MATQPTQNAVPSESPRDLKFNAGKIDEFVTSLALQYIDRFGQAHYTIEGLRKLAQEAIASFGYITMDSFQGGATLTLPNQVLRDEVTGEYYRWDGDFPKVVASGSTPASSGGVATGAWVSVGDAALRQMLATNAGAGAIGTTSGNTVQQELSMSRIVANVRDPQFAGGAKGNWNEAAQTGTDDTAAFQAAINYLASLPTERNGGVRVLYVPAGTYMTKGLKIPQSYVFGFNMLGAGRDATMIYCNPLTPTATPGLLSEVEFIFIDNLTMTGSGKSTIIDTANYVTDLIKVALPGGRADCDLVCGEGLRLLNAANLITLYGRGLVFKGLAALATNFLNIYCSSNQSWTSGSAIDDFNTGMRHYQIDGCRFDQFTSLVTVSGTGSAIDYIHGLRITNNDMLGVGTIVQAPTATLRGFNMTGNTMLQSGNANVVYCYGMVGGIINSNVISKLVGLESVPSVANDCLPRVVRADRAIIGLTIMGNEFGAIRDTVVSATIDSSSVRIIGNTFHQAFILSSGTIFTGANCSGLMINNNSFTGGSNSIQPWSNSLQTYIANFKNNVANVKFTHPGLTYTPVVTKGTTAVTPTISTGYWDYDGYYCTVRLAVNAPIGGSGSTINISTPMAPLADFPSLTGSVSGGGVITYLAGSSVAITARVLTTGVINLIVASTGVAMAGTDVTASLSVELEVKFKA